MTTSKTKMTKRYTHTLAADAAQRRHARAAATLVHDLMEIRTEAWVGQREAHADAQLRLGRIERITERLLNEAKAVVP